MTLSTDTFTNPQVTPVSLGDVVVVYVAAALSLIALGALTTTVFVALLLGLREAPICYATCYGDGDAIDQSNVSGTVYMSTHLLGTFYGMDPSDVMARSAAALLALAALALFIVWRGEAVARLSGAPDSGHGTIRPVRHWGGNA